MGTVWRGHDRQLDRSVAVKSPHPLPPGDPRRDRLTREARLAASVSHANLVEVFDVGHDDEGPFLVMEFVDAPSLRAVGSQLDQRQVLVVGAEVARALDAVHRAGVVHRDVKPSNVLLAPAGAKLVDFGVARAVDGQTGFEPTAAGVVLGTAGYTAPEVRQGQPATARSDVYGLGVILREFLAPRPVGPGSGATATVRATVDASVVAIVDACVADDPGHRPDAAAVARILAQAATAAADRAGQPPVAEAPTSLMPPGLAARRATTVGPPPPGARPEPPGSIPSGQPAAGPSTGTGDRSAGRRGDGPPVVALAVALVVLAVVTLLALADRAADDRGDAEAGTSSDRSAASPSSTSTTLASTSTTVSTTSPSEVPTTSPSEGSGTDGDTGLLPQLPLDDPEAVESVVAETLDAIIGPDDEDEVEAIEDIAEAVAEAGEALADGDEVEAAERFREGAVVALRDLEGESRRRTVVVLEAWADQLGIRTLLGRPRLDG